MTNKGFTKIWNLLGALFPTAPQTKNDLTMRVWEKALQPYDTGEVSELVMAYAKKNKFFPDLADITAGIVCEASTETDATSWMVPYIDKNERALLEKYGGWDAYYDHRRSEEAAMGRLEAYDKVMAQCEDANVQAYYAKLREV